MMKLIRPLCVSLAIGFALSACQTPQSRQAQLETICADAVNRQPGSFYWGECQSLYPSSDRKLQKDFQINSPTAD